MFCRKYSISNVDLLRGNFELHKRDWTLFQDYLKNIQCVFASDFGKTWKEVDDLMSNLETIPELIIIDYIQAIAGVSNQGKMFIDEYIRHFKQLCSEHNFCGVLVSQLNRTNPEKKEKTPKLHQLKGSGFLEENCDVCVLLDWMCKHTDTEDKSYYTAHIAKNRNGRTGYIRMEFQPEYYNFKEYEEVSEYQHAIGELNSSVDKS